MKRAATLPAIGEVFTVSYPFSRDTYEALDIDEEGISTATVPSWKVGPKPEHVYPDDCQDVADGIGQCAIVVVSVHKPGRYPARVFFTRSWIAPDGKAFGKGKLRIAVAGAFRALIGGYRHQFVLRGCKCEGCKWNDHRSSDKYEAYKAWVDEPVAVGAVDPVSEKVTDGPRS